MSRCTKGGLDGGNPSLGIKVRPVVVRVVTYRGGGVGVRLRACDVAARSLSLPGTVDRGCRNAPGAWGVGAELVDA